MTLSQTNELTRRNPLRLWPRVAIVALQWLLWLVVPLVVPPEAAIVGMIGGVACERG